MMAAPEAKQGRRRKGSKSTIPEGGGGRWTKKEDENLKQGVASVGPRNWKRISIEFLDGK
jgi:hypothetical protein